MTNVTTTHAAWAASTKYRPPRSRSDAPTFCVSPVSMSAETAESISPNGLDDVPVCAIELKKFNSPSEPAILDLERNAEYFSSCRDDKRKMLCVKRSFVAAQHSAACKFPIAANSHVRTIRPQNRTYLCCRKSHTSRTTKDPPGRATSIAA